VRVAGSAMIGSDREQVWAALRDPAVLVRTIPGCERLEAVSADSYRMTVSAGVASIKGVYQGEVALSDPDEPERFVLKARGQGAPGMVDATVAVRLSPVDGGTRVDYDAEAVVGGMIGGVGQRMLVSVAKKTAAEFFAAVESHLASAPAARVTAPAAVPAVPGAEAQVPSAAERPVPAVTAPAPGQIFERPAGEPRPGVPAWALLVAFGMGAGISLGSAVLGWLLGRAGRAKGGG
jgi:carbon monoxide dehydrogenase subunit G